MADLWRLLSVARASPTDSNCNDADLLVGSHLFFLGPSATNASFKKEGAASNVKLSYVNYLQNGEEDDRHQFSQGCALRGA